MPCQARNMTSWATSSASPRSPSNRNSSMNRRSAYLPDSRSNAATSPAWAWASRLASVSATSGARRPSGGLTPPRLTGPGRRSSRAPGRPRARPGHGRRRRGRASRGCRARSRCSPARDGQAAAARGGAGPPRRSGRDAAVTIRGRRSGRAPASPLPPGSGLIVTVVQGPEPVRPPRSAAGLLLARGRGLERQRARVDAVPLAGRPGTVVEDVAEVAAAAAADDLGAPHEQAVIRPQFDRLGDRGLVEAGPPGARVELGVRAEQLGAAAGTPVEAVPVVVDVLTGERHLGVRPAQDVVLLRGQLLTPLLVRLGDLAGGGCLGAGTSLTHGSGSFPSGPSPS